MDENAARELAVLRASVAELRAAMGANRLVLQSLMARLCVLGAIDLGDIAAIGDLAMDRAERVETSARSGDQVHSARMRKEIGRLMGQFNAGRRKPG